MAESLLAAVRHCASDEPVRSLLSAAHVAAEVNKPGPSGVNALGLAVWRNHAGLVEALLEAGADPDAPDSESGWAPLHRALHWGQLRIAAELLRGNASLAVPDWRGRTPLDLLSAELKEYLDPGDGDVFSWGNGNNYTLGTGSEDVQLHPARLESLHDQQVVSVSAGKFHSVAVSADGRMLTWGWGRGGRLGHPEAHVHSGEGAVIAPLVVSSLGKRQVAAVAAGKHHTVLCTTAGEVYTCGSNRHGQLGYAVDSQPTPRRVASLRQRMVAVAAANKHSVAVTASGDVYTWGCNVLGQLGYGTSDSTSNAAPRLVEAMRGKPVVAAAAAKRHTVVLTAGGEVYTWGHRGVSPRRIQLAGARDAVSLSGAPITFHRGHSDVARPLAQAVCAGAAHSSALTCTGVVLSWRSADPALQVQEVGGVLAGKRIVTVSAGKYRTAAVSDEGDVFMWEGRSDYFPAEGRQPGSGSKKPGSGSAARGSATRARPIPGSSRTSLGGEGAPLGGSYGSADVHGGSYGSASHSRRAGSWIERFGQEREAAASSGTAAALFTKPGSYGAAGSGGRTEMLPGNGGGSGVKTSRAGDTFEIIRPERVEGLKRAVAVAVGEKHSLAVQRWSAAQLDGTVSVPWLHLPTAAPQQGSGTEAAAAAAAGAEEDTWYQRAADGDGVGSLLSTPRDLDPSAALDSPSSALPSPSRPSPVRLGPRRMQAAGAIVGVPSLQRICEEEVARRLVDPRTCLQVLEYADVAGAELLRAYCLAVAVCNLDAVLLEAGGAFEELAPHLLAELERLYKLRLVGASVAGSTSGSAATSRAQSAALHQAAEPAGLPADGRFDGGRAGGQAAAPTPVQHGSRLQPGRRPSAAAPWLGDEGVEVEGLPPGIQLPLSLAAGGSSFRDRSQADAEAAVQRLQRTLQKKLQQVEHLAAKVAAGSALDAQQRCKLDQQPVFQSALAALEGGMAVDDVMSILRAVSTGAEEEVCGSRGGKAAAAAAGGTSSASKHAKGKARRSIGQAAVAGDEGLVAGLTSSAAVSAGAEASGCLLGSSPPACSLVPAFGFERSAAAPITPSALHDEASPRGSSGHMLSQVGFASASASDGAGTGFGGAGPAEESPGVTRASGGRPKSAAKRKGALSMFLRGELEQAAASEAAAAAAAEASTCSGGVVSAAPAWGAKSAPPAGAPSLSLKQILDQEAAGSASKPATAGTPQQRTTPHAGIKSRSALDSPSTAAAAAGGGSGTLRLSLASFISHSSPVAVKGPAREAAPSPPPPAWGGASGASPPGRQASLRAIQQQQQAAQPPPKTYASSPPTVTRLSSGLPPWRPPVAPAPAPGASGGVGGGLLGTSPSASGSLMGTSPSGRTSSFVVAPKQQHSKWYVPEEARADTRKSLLSIQTEEEAEAELSKALAAIDAASRAHPKAEQRRAPGLPRPGPTAKQQQQKVPQQQQQQTADLQQQLGQSEEQQSAGEAGGERAEDAAAAAAAAGGSGAPGTEAQPQRQRQRQQGRGSGESRRGGGGGGEGRGRGDGSQAAAGGRGRGRGDGSSSQGGRGRGRGGKPRGERPSSGDATGAAIDPHSQQQQQQQQQRQQQQQQLPEGSAGGGGGTRRSGDGSKPRGPRPGSGRPRGERPSSSGGAGGLEAENQQQQHHHEAGSAGVGGGPRGSGDGGRPRGPRPASGNGKPRTERPRSGQLPGPGTVPARDGQQAGGGGGSTEAGSQQRDGGGGGGGGDTRQGRGGSGGRRSSNVSGGGSGNHSAAPNPGAGRLHPHSGRPGGATKQQAQQQPHPQPQPAHQTH